MICVKFDCNQFEKGDVSGEKFGNETQLLAKVVQKLAVIRALATDLGHKRFLSKCVGWCCQMRIAYSQLLDISQLFLNFSVR